MDSVGADAMLTAVLSVFLAYGLQQNFINNILAMQFLVEKISWTAESIKLFNMDVIIIPKKSR